MKDSVLPFFTDFIWQGLVAGTLIAIYRSGIVRKVVEFQLSPQGITLKLEKDVREIGKQQNDLRRDVDALRFLVSGFVTDWELVHLRKLAIDEPFPYSWGGTRDDRFVKELVRLRDFGLIQRELGSIWDLPREGDLRQFIKITPRGRDYLRLLDEVTSTSNVIASQQK